MRRRISSAYFVIPALGILFALLFSAQNLYRTIVLGKEVGWRDVLANALPRWVLYSFLAPLVGWLVERKPVESGRVGRRMAVHALGGVLFSLAHSVILALYFALFRLYPPGETVLGAATRLLLVYFGLNLVVYGAIAGAWHAIRYFREAKKREIQAAELRASLSEARLLALRSQLNPHFLFNVLNGASTLALTGQKDGVVKILDRLSDLLRVSLDPNLPQEIPLEREVAILSAYLDILRIRFGDRLETDVVIEPEALTALVPSMVLQPIVENAFEHGVARRPGPGRIAVRADRYDGGLRIRVEDSGPGFDGARTNGRLGIGLRNTTERLQQLYDEGARLDKGNLDGGGAYVELRIPLRFPGDPA